MSKAINSHNDTTKQLWVVNIALSVGANTSHAQCRLDYILCEMQKKKDQPLCLNKKEIKELFESKQ